MAVSPRSLVGRFRAVGAAIVLSAMLTTSSVALAAEPITIGGVTYVNKGLVGVGRLPADLRDKFDETFGSGSGREGTGP
jgi:hypothetical protein